MAQKIYLCQNTFFDDSSEGSDEGNYMETGLKSRGFCFTVLPFQKYFNKQLTFIIFGNA